MLSSQTSVIRLCNGISVDMAKFKFEKFSFTYILKCFTSFKINLMLNPQCIKMEAEISLIFIKM